MPAGIDLEVEGVNELVNRLAKFDKDIYKILTKEVREGLSDVASHARSLTPSGRALSGWGPWSLTTGQNAQVGSISLVTGSRDLGFNGSEVKRGIKPRAVRRSRRGKVTSFSGQVVTRTAAGAIYSLAGSKDNTDSFNRYLNIKRGRTFPRALTDARNAKGPDAAKAITEAVQRAAKAVEGRRV